MDHPISPELNRLFEQLLGTDKRLVFDQIGRKLPHTFRFNSLKGYTSDLQSFFLEQGFKFDAVEGQDNIFQITFQPYPIGRSLSHFLGHIYVQDIASMVPAIVLEPQPGELVLDMSAAPGSKTTQIGELMANRGIIVANDIVSKRLRALGKNIERMGLLNTVVYNWYGEQFGNVFFETFDRILLDPACSGLGTLHKNPEILDWWTPAHCERLAAGQRNLLISALKALRPGGVLVYSTCTLTPEENEAVVEFALKQFPLEIEEISLPGLRTWPGLDHFGGRSFHPELRKSVRLYPVEELTEGFFICRLRKTESLRAPHPSKRKKPRHLPILTSRTSPVKKYLDFVSNLFDIPPDLFKRYRYLMNKEVVFLTPEIEDFPVIGRPQQMGLSLIRTMDRGAKLTTSGCHLLGGYARQRVVELDNLQQVEEFVNRLPIDIPIPGKGQYLVRYNNCVLGYGIAEGGVLKSQFPKGDWPFKVIGEWDSKGAPADDESGM